MDIYMLIAAFGGGAFGALVGSIPAFILTGILAIVGGLLGLAGIAEPSIGNITFGSFLGPHIAFTGGVAAAAFAGNKRKTLENPNDVLTPLYGINDYTVIIMGGIFGVIGFLFNYLYGTLLKFNTDLPAISVFSTLIVSRLVFGKTGAVGKYTGEGSRQLLPSAKTLINHIVLGVTVAIVVSGVGISMLNSGVPKAAMAMYPIVCFGISATSLVFLQMGFGVPVTHHITLPVAAVTIMTGNIFLGVIIGVICAVVWLIAGNIFNSHCDTYIDPPATTIFIMMFIINAVFI
jgi:hypothetical protein